MAINEVVISYESAKTMGIVDQVFDEWKLWTHMGQGCYEDTFSAWQQGKLYLLISPTAYKRIVSQIP